jgi:hypothetical protein
LAKRPSSRATMAEAQSEVAVQAIFNWNGAAAAAEAARATADAAAERTSLRTETIAFLPVVIQ